MVITIIIIVFISIIKTFFNVVIAKLCTHLIIKHRSEGQTIIVENSKDLPYIDYETAGAKVIEFTQDNYVSKYKESRYGFLIGIVCK